MPMTQEQMLARIAELEKQVLNKGVTARCKVSPKGGVSFYGTGRWPVTLYKSQWEILFANAETIKAFILANDALLSQGKEDKEGAQQALAAVTA
jgi:hypothetical protein